MLLAAEAEEEPVPEAADVSDADVAVGVEEAVEEAVEDKVTPCVRAVRRCSNFNTGRLTTAAQS